MPLNGEIFDRRINAPPSILADDNPMVIRKQGAGNNNIDLLWDKVSFEIATISSEMQDHVETDY